MKRLVLILTLTLLILLLSGCGRVGGEETTSGEAVTTASETEKVKSTEPKGVAVVPNPDWGFPVHAIRVLDESVVTAELDNVTGNVILTSYNPGETEVYVLDCFEHRAIVKVSVADDAECSITFEANPCEEEFINAAKYGVLPGGSPNNLPDQSTKLQALIDKVWKQGGGEIFLYPGFYNIKLISMRDGITLRMYSGFTDAREGYTAELAEKVKKGEVTVLIRTRILNTNLKDFGRNGSSNFTISGGVIDNDRSGTSSILLGLSRGVTIENIVFKDIKNSHLMQITGCEDVIVRNCIFAGFEWGGTFTRETIQIEQSHPGAHNSDHENAPVRFADGEIFGCKNITIDSCYFGPSDELPGHHIAIGHHGTAHEAVCDNLRITNNVFDRPTYAAIRFASITNVEITGNTFIADRDSNKFCDKEDPAFIILYANTSNVTYENIVDGRKITKAQSFEQAGTHNVNISGNSFTVGKASDKKILIATGNTASPGILYKENILRQDTYDSKPYMLTGYFKSTNFFGNIKFTDNTVKYEGQPDFKTYAFRFQNIYGLNYENNTLDFVSCSFSKNDDGVKGLSLSAIREGEKAKTYVIQGRATNRYVLLTHADGTEAKLVFTSTESHSLIAGEGGRIELSGDNRGNVTVTVIAEDGYVFDGWTTESGAFTSTGNVKITSKTTFTANFKKK